MNDSSAPSIPSSQTKCSECDSPEMTADPNAPGKAMCAKCGTNWPIHFLLPEPEYPQAGEIYRHKKSGRDYQILQTGIGCAGYLRDQCQQGTLHIYRCLATGKTYARASHLWHREKADFDLLDPVQLAIRAQVKADSAMGFALPNDPDELDGPKHGCSTCHLSPICVCL